MSWAGAWSWQRIREARSCVWLEDALSKTLCQDYHTHASMAEADLRPRCSRLWHPDNGGDVSCSYRYHSGRSLAKRERERERGRETETGTETERETEREREQERERERERESTSTHRSRQSSLSLGRRGKGCASSEVCVWMSLNALNVWAVVFYMCTIDYSCIQQFRKSACGSRACFPSIGVVVAGSSMSPDCMSNCQQQDGRRGASGENQHLLHA